MFLLCLRRTVVRGRAQGYLTGFGVATADGVYAALAAFGVEGAVAVASGQRRWIELVGGILLLAIGVRSALARLPAREPEAASEGRFRRPALAGAYASGLALTLANPSTIVSFAAVFAGLGAARGPGLPLPLVFGVVAGSTTWWLVLVTFAAAVRKRLLESAARGLAAASGAGIACFGVLSMASAIRGG